MSSNNKGYKIGIDASRNRSGGAIAYLMGIINYGNPIQFGISEIHVWAPKKLLDTLEDKPWLYKHNPKQLQQSLLKQIIWQLINLKKEAQKIGIDLLFTTEASTLSKFAPMIVMSQDLQSFEPGIMQTYDWNKARLRLITKLYLQKWSMKSSVGVIFLTNYTMKTVQKKIGKLYNNNIVIPHGIGQNFKDQPYSPKQKLLNEGIIKCVYVSNTQMYKHQWNVVKAISNLRVKGFSIELTLVGGGGGKSRELLDLEIINSDPDNKFVTIIEFVNNIDMPNLLSKFDISIFASSCENLPITLLENMAIGLPIACSNRGPMPDVLQNEGEFFNPEDIDSISIAIEKIINNDSIRLMYGENAKKLALAYSWEKCSDTTWKFLTDNIIKK